MSASRRVKYWVEMLIILGIFICVPGSYAQNSEEPNVDGCPQITVRGPAGIPELGELIWFDVELSPEPRSNLTYYWATNTGKINEGQSTKRVGVRYLMEMRGTTLVATVKISGLPPNCGDAASEDTPLIWEPVPELMSEFSIPIASIHQRNLRAAANEQKSNPNDQIYIIEYFPPGISERSIRLKKNKIMAFMVKTLKVDGLAVRIVTAEADRPLTRIYVIPPGVENPIP